MPRIHEPVATFDQEMQLVRACLDVMHMRMPDRLNFNVQMDQNTAVLQCPPTTILTLVDNAVRHGIDPSKSGGAAPGTYPAIRGKCSPIARSGARYPQRPTSTKTGRQLASQSASPLHIEGLEDGSPGT